MRIAARRTSAAVKEQGARNVAFVLFCAFTITYFLHFTRRWAPLGTIHLDLLLALATVIASALAARKGAVGRRGSPPPREQMDPVTVRLWILVGYIIVTIPLVEWPGSVLVNMEPFAKSISLYFLVLAIVDTTRKLRWLLGIYVFTQAYRVLEPLVMHLKSGYWGSSTSIGNWEIMDRLSGAPSDIINPNGLAFVIILTLPMLHFLVRPDTALRRVVWVAIAAAMCYALVLSASRSGFLAFLFLCLFVIWRSKHRVTLLAATVVVSIVAVSLMTGLQKGRYLSIVSSNAPGAATAQERIEGVKGDFKVSLRRPFFGHGLGTSREANVHFRNVDLPSHNLYTEAAEELGYIGLALLLALIWSFVRACRIAQQVTSAAGTENERLRFLHSVASSLVVVVAVDLFFSFAAYGLSEPYWYFYGGLTVVTARLAIKLAPAAARENAAAVAARASRSFRGRSRGAAVAGGRMLAAARIGRTTPRNRS
jgi:putative inorganic carbon (HCO3(-)) transporter